MTDPQQDNRSDEKLSVDSVQDQLGRILSGKNFLNASQLSSFLRFVVEETLAGRSDQIKQYTIAVQAFGRSPSFNSQTDSIVRIEARRLRRALDQYYSTQGKDDPIRIEIPVGSYVPVFFANINPLQRAKPSNKHAESLSTALEPPMLGHDGPSIAVMSMVLLGSAADDAYLASGITEEIVIALTRFPDFLVIGPLDRDRIWRQHLDPRGIGREFNVRFILDGTVRRRAQLIRLTVKLTDALSGRQLWGEALEYDLETSSIAQIEDDVVGQITAIIADNFGVIPRTLMRESQISDVESISDYEAILRVYHHFNVATEDSLVDSVAALETILQRDPDHALASAYLADLIASNYHLGFIDSISEVERAEELGCKAVAKDPNCQPAHYAMALIHFLQFERAYCLEEIERVLWLNPNHPNYLAASSLLISMVGEWEHGLALMDKALRLNPHHPGWYNFIRYMDHYRRSEYEAALAEAQRFNTPELFWDPLIHAAVLGKLDRQGEAKTAVTKLLSQVPDFESRADSLIRRMVFLDEHVDMLVDGLLKAGLQVD